MDEEIVLIFAARNKGAGRRVGIASIDVEGRCLGER